MIVVALAAPEVVWPTFADDRLLVFRLGATVSMSVIGRAGVALLWRCERRPRGMLVVTVHVMTGVLVESAYHV